MIKYTEVLTKITIHPLFWAVIAIGVWTAHFKELLVLFFIVFVHELGHGFAAAYYGWRIKQIQLLPFGGVAELEEHGNKPLKEELLVILAGPAQHVWMIMAAYALHWAGFMGDSFYTFFLWNNITILLFNLLPIWPLDGGKLVFNIFSNGFPFLKAHRWMMAASGVCFFAAAGIGLIWNTTNLTMWTMLVFLGISMYMEWRQRQYTFIRFLLERYYGRKRDIEKITSIVADRDDPLYTIFEQFRRGYKHSIIIKGKQEQYTLDENELLYAYFTEKRISSSIGELIG
ncbi:M50 family metallopeptidase [Ectobacillus panaciterrae]|uniref:M50 family metallopeptidase n=1 Tax=Ectobacillus panaciterrae TaxID=363872 RepID=UPI00041141B2|nr:M50 family metallopeptidase [Ectobacillus panaciterrae]